MKQIEEKVNVKAQDTQGKCRDMHVCIHKNSLKTIKHKTRNHNIFAKDLECKSKLN